MAKIKLGQWEVEEADLDRQLDFSLAGLIAGVFGTPVWMAELGRRGGQVISEAKAAAARRNGRKGGRPGQAARKRRVG